MRILIACEESQTVCKAFREKGHEAYSNDILNCSGGHPEWHLKGYLEDIIGAGNEWNMIIAFPPCTNLSSSGARHFWYKRQNGSQQFAINFFMMIANRDCPKIAIENPVGIMSSEFRKPDQIIQPYQFGHDASKKTCLWLKGLPLLKPTKLIEGKMSELGKLVWGNQTASGQNKLAPSPERARIRSKTYEGIAKAMAEQWG